MKKRIFAAFLAAVMLAATLAACSSGGQTGDNTPEKRAKNGEIVIGVAQDFDSLDPDHMTAAGT
ncbi:MAG: ABC transporter substrate-binding protein, partial [Oscillospiraceae bacterium]|nr:ABC transporter substrate-binding protein [Oscillospiraceae bacterium]